MNEPKDKANEAEVQSESKAKYPLQKPASYAIIEDFTESTHRARRNLLIFAIIALFYKLSGATPTKKLSFLGLELELVNLGAIDIFLFLIVLYHLIHFEWLAVEHWKKNLILLTRMVEKDKRGGLGTIDLEDWGWNLYSWWKKSKEGETGFIQMSNKHSEIRDLIEPLRKIIDEKENYTDSKNQLYNYLLKI